MFHSNFAHDVYGCCRPSEKSSDTLKGMKCFVQGLSMLFLGVVKNELIERSMYVLARKCDGRTISRSRFTRSSEVSSIPVWISI